MSSEIIVYANGYLMLPRIENAYIAYEKKVIKLITSASVFIVLCDDGTINIQSIHDFGLENFTYLDGTERAIYTRIKTITNAKDMILLGNTLFVFMNDDTLSICGYAEKFIAEEFRTNVKNVAYHQGIYYLHYCNNKLISFSRDRHDVLPYKPELIISHPNFVIGKNNDQIIIINGQLPSNFVSEWFIDPNYEFYSDNIRVIFAVRNKVTNDLHIYSNNLTEHVVHDVKSATCLCDSIIIVKCDNTVQTYNMASDLSLSKHLETLTDVDKIVTWYLSYNKRILVIFNDGSMSTIVFDIYPMHSKHLTNFTIKYCTIPFILF